MGPKDLNFVYWLCLVSTAGVFSAPRCSDNGFFSRDRTFDGNRGLILSSLASNVTKGGGFYNASIGQDSDTVYAQGLCGEGYQTEDCESCVNAQSQELIKQCPNQTEAFSWGGDNILCLVSYSNSSTYGSVMLNPVFILTNSRNLSSNLTQYNEIWQGLMNQTIETASAGTVPTLRYYAVGLKQLTLFDTIYTVMQCTPDITKSDCNSCLRLCKDDHKACCHGKRGGIVARPSCYLRWELYPIHGAFEKNNTPSPPPLPSSRPQPSLNEAKEKDGASTSSGIIAAIVVPVVIIILVLFGLLYTLCWKKKTYKSSRMVAEPDGLSSLRFDLSFLREATNDFSTENKLGQGGFGTVFKGKFPNGQEIAVKRLSMDSGQGDQEFKNEILLLAGLQHRNLVKLLGFCLERIEKLLVYEFVPNSSLDQLLFDLKKRSLLTWNTRFKIIGGIARGVLYLHEDSRLRIIHRDLKASNVLLDEEMNPKISDFGMARLFEGDETRGETSRVMGTFGYMSPEYVRCGHLSVKSDVYSFGVLVLEILTGRKNTSFQAEGLPAYAWKSWSEGRVMDITDPVVGIGSRSEIMRCFHIGLLCVQESVRRRPTMNSVVMWLTSGSTSLPKPTTPAFLIKKPFETETSSSGFYRSGASASDMSKGECSWYDDPVTELEPR